MKLEPARVHAGDLEEIVHLREENAGVPASRLERDAHARTVLLSGEHAVERADDERERSAQLVAHVREQRRLLGVRAGEPGVQDLEVPCLVRDLRLGPHSIGDVAPLGDEVHDAPGAVAHGIEREVRREEPGPAVTAVLDLVPDELAFCGAPNRAAKARLRVRQPPPPRRVPERPAEDVPLAGAHRLDRSTVRCDEDAVGVEKAHELEH